MTWKLMHDLAYETFQRELDKHDLAVDVRLLIGLLIGSWLLGAAVEYLVFR